MSDIFAGDILDAGQIGVLAGAGYQSVTVKANPKVCISVTHKNDIQLLTMGSTNIKFKRLTMVSILDHLMVFMAYKLRFV